MNDFCAQKRQLGKKKKYLILSDHQEPRGSSTSPCVCPSAFCVQQCPFHIPLCNSLHTDSTSRNQELTLLRWLCNASAEMLAVPLSFPQLGWKQRYNTLLHLSLIYQQAHSSNTHKQNRPNMIFCHITKCTQCLAVCSDLG